MDDFSKQKLNEEKYRNMRNNTSPVEDYKGDFKSKHYKETKNPTIAQTKIAEKEVFTTEYKQDFDNASRDFWQKNTQTGIMKYNGGSITANFGKEEYTLDELLQRIGNFIKESITTELAGKGIPTTDLTENFKAVEISLKMLAKSVNTINPDTDIKNITAFLHGFINTYVNNIITKKIEREQGQTKNG
jgi:hypothetical protein